MTEMRFDGERILGGNQARERFYDARGYGRPHDGGIELAPVEVAHLLFRGDVETVRDARDSAGAQMLDFEAFLASAAVSEVDFFVYKELRDRGFYLSPVRDSPSNPARFVVYPRGKGPWDEVVAYRVGALSERTTVAASTLFQFATDSDTHSDSTDDTGNTGATSDTGDTDDTGDTADTDDTGDAVDTDNTDETALLAVVDEESEVTYLELDRPAVTGSTHHDISSAKGVLLSDRVLVPNPPTALYDRAFYGQRLDRDDEALQLSLVEAAYLSSEDLLTLDSADDGEHRIIARGREVEGDRFNRRLHVYGSLRDAGIVPKTGFKFGADFRTYAAVESVDNLGHSEFLVRVLPPEHSFVPRDLSLDVRLAHGVRKRMLFAFADEERIDWLSVQRVTP